jgi:hypothetical protein
MLMVVANAEGLATGVPLFEVIVAFSEAITDPVELISTAMAMPTTNGNNRSFIVNKCMIESRKFGVPKLRELKY